MTPSNDLITIGVGAVLPNGLVHGHGCSIGAYSYVADGCALEDNVDIGARATVMPPGGPSTTDDHHPRLLLRAGARIGAGAVVCGPSIIERGARIEPGAVVTSDVPPYAIVAGNPAYVVGYVSPLGGGGPERPVSMVHAPPTVGSQALASGASVIRFPEFADLRGLLSFGEVGGLLPFEVRRFFLVYGVPSREIRGEHAHHTLHQLLIAVTGTVSVLTDNGTEREEIQLNGPTVGVHIPPMVWGVQFRHSPDAVLLVLASDQYDAADYIREYDEFLRLVP
jgi:UDP-2-acetamido-3-amino-2,3-dideoxy-glucuronate N-acetyltransferase